MGVAVADNERSAYGRYWTQVLSNAAPDEVPQQGVPGALGPIIDSIAPSSGRAGVGVMLTVSGSGFDASCSVWFAYQQQQVTRFVDRGTLEAFVPGGHFPRPGTYTVVVMSGSGVQSNDATFVATGDESIPPNPNPTDPWAKEGGVGGRGCECV